MLVTDDGSREMRAQMNEEEEERELEEFERAKKNNGFVQLYRSQIKHLRRLTLEDPSAAAVFLFLTEYMGRSNAVACSYTLLEEALGISRSSVYRAVKTLKEGGYLSVTKMGTSNVYHLNAELVWSSWATGKRYAEMRARILVSESEQVDAEVNKTERELVPVLSISEQ